MHLNGVERWLLGILVVAASAAMANGQTTEDLLFPNSDFEQGDLTNWKADGQAFKDQPTLGDNVKVRRKTKSALLRGKYWVGTFERYQGKPGQKPGDAQGDKMQGGLLSKGFTISRPHISFLIGGCCSEAGGVQLIVNGEIVRMATGAYGEAMREVIWDVSKWQGKQGILHVFDHTAGVWGHLNVDDFRYVDKVPDRLLFPNSDFELGDLGNWTAEGEAFTGQPEKNEASEEPGNISPAQPIGKFWLRSVAVKDGEETKAEEDTAQGVLRSIPFTVKGSLIACRVMGGKGKGLRIEIHAGGKAVEWIRGIGEHNMRSLTWNVSAYRGKLVEIVLIDEEPEAGAYLGVDAFYYGRLD